ncbi:MAG TPA: hypothetical protein PKD12_00300 [Nitrospira sp.]|nr:hypothetical protein [Nitrospira sp.]
MVTFAVVVGRLFAAPSDTDCHQIPAMKDGEHWFQATETVVEPWFGRHHVYGVFTIPITYKFDHLFTANLVIQGIHDALQAGSPEYTDMPSSTWETGSYRKRVYLSTRATIRFVGMGKFGDLKMPCHWWLVIKDRVA